jgi:hypothetical protein
MLMKMLRHNIFVKSKTKHGRIKSKVFMRVCLLGLPCGFYVCYFSMCVSFRGAPLKQIIFKIIMVV